MNNLLVILCHLLPETVAFSKSFLYESQKQNIAKIAKCHSLQDTIYLSASFTQDKTNG